MRTTAVMELLHIDRSCLRRLVKRGIIHARKLSGCRMDYDLEDVLYYQQNKEKIHQEIRQKACTPRARIHVTDFTPEELADSLGCTLKDLAHPYRGCDITDCRRAFAVLMKQRNYSHEEIGAYLHRSHCTVSQYLSTAYLADDLLADADKKLKSRRPH